MTDDLEKAKRVRASIIGLLTKQRNSFDERSEMQELTVSNLNVMSTMIDDYYNRYTVASQKVIELSTEKADLDTSNAKDEEFAESYVSLKSQIMEFLSNQDDTRRGSLNGTLNNSSHQRSVRLPKLELPKFSGNFHQWIDFKSEFTSMIMNDDSLTDIERFRYLRSSLTEGPRRIISNMEITAANFAAAWQALCHRYDDNSLIFRDHINQILSLQGAGGAENIRATLDKMQSHYRSLKAMGTDEAIADNFIIAIALSKLDPKCQSRWEEATTKDIATWTDFSTFLEKYASSLQRVESKKPTPPPNTTKFGKKSTTFLSTDKKCLKCKIKNHDLRNCPDFAMLNPKERYQVAKSVNACIRCLLPFVGHGFCKARCSVCSGSHDVLLHYGTMKSGTSKPDHEQTPSTSTGEPPKSAFRDYAGSQPKPNANSESPHKTLIASNPLRREENVFLASATVMVCDGFGNHIPCNAILDSGSTDNYVSERFVRALNVKRNGSQVTVGGIGNAIVRTKGFIDLKFLPWNFSNRREYNVRASILSRITESFPSTLIDISTWGIETVMNLADPNFNVPKRIDLLIGGGLFWSLLNGDKRSLGPDLPLLFGTDLGDIVVGPHFTTRGMKVGLLSHQMQHGDDFQPPLDKLVERFWQLDSFDESRPQVSPDDQICEDFYAATTTRDSSGRYFVRLPLRGDPSTLGFSFNIASRRFFNLEKRLARLPEVKQQYSDFIAEYSRLGHLELVEHFPYDKPTYYLPHHCVIKPDSTSTKLRVVFDASCKTDNGISLNDVLYSGPKLQNDLFVTLLRFRLFRYVVTGDIQKMYRQVYVTPDDANLQMILWRESPSDPLKSYRLTTVTYGTACGAYLAIKTLYRLADDECERFPIGARLLRECFYVDDAMFGSNDVNDLQESLTQLSSILKAGCFALTKFCSNSQQILDRISPEDREKSLLVDDHDVVKALGMMWKPDTDQFRFTSKITPSDAPVTKRLVLSNIARLFDPLGLLCPIVTRAKIFFQNLWQIRPKLGWDDELPADLAGLWTQYEESLSSICKIAIPRHALHSNEIKFVEIHGFCDASEKAYGACVYVRVVHDDGTVSVSLFTSKSKVAPVKIQTVARLELCGALLLCKLTERLLAEVFNDVRIKRTYFWSDSMIVLDWLNAPSSRWNTFVAHRVARIQEKSDITQWRHIPGDSNPADLLSRGTCVSDLIDCDLWWCGPPFLRQRHPRFDDYRPSEDFSSLPEYRAPKTTLMARKVEDLTCLLTGSTGFRGTRRVFAYIQRFIKRCKKSEHSKAQRKRMKKDLSRTIQRSVVTLEEEEFAEISLIRLIQKSNFPSEYLALSTGQSLPNNSSIGKLVPFIDESNGLMRVGGRLKKSSLPIDSKHQILLPRDHFFTRALITYYHSKKLFHAGPLTVLTNIRTKYWPVGGLQATRSVVTKCVWCFRMHPRMMSQIMGQLPPERVNFKDTKPFLVTGVDFAGPIRVRHHIRCKQQKEVHLALFICFYSKAVHVELVPDRSTESFMLALKRLIADRGAISKMFSDNATNFRGAANYLKELKNSLLKDADKISSDCRNMEIEWSFIAPRTPHQGGLWEASIKLLKRLIKNIVGSVELTQDELATVAKQAASIINSRPLTPLSADPNDLQPLTPSHFLYGCAPSTIYETPISDVENVHQLRLIYRMRFIFQKLWDRFHKEYLSLLQARTKWHTRKANVKVGDMVILQVDHCEPLCWPLGRVIECKTDDSGDVRNVKVRTVAGEYERGIQRIALLPFSG